MVEVAGKREYAVKEFMTKGVVTISPAATVVDCARLMAKSKVSSAVVVGKGTILGMVTENDLARKAVAAELDCRKSRVRAIMSGNVVTVAPEASLYEAMIIMGRKKVKHLPVVRAGKLVGIITAMDILRVQPAYIDLLSYSVF